MSEVNKTPTVFFVGNSHTTAVQHALEQIPFEERACNYFVLELTAAFGSVNSYQIMLNADGSVSMNPQVFQALEAVREPSSPTYYVSMLGGNDHNIYGILQSPAPFDFILPERPDLPLIPYATVLPYSLVKQSLERLMKDPISALIGFRRGLTKNVFHIESPPPVGNDKYFETHLEPAFREYLGDLPLAPRLFRYKMWKVHSNIIREVCEANDIYFIPVPESVTDSEGFMREEGYCENGVTHGNNWYGQRIISQVNELLGSAVRSVAQCPAVLTTCPAEPDHPYKRLRDFSHWKKAIAEPAPEQVDPVVDFKFKILPEDRVATAGSCFAQHISRHLKKSGFNYFVTEPGPFIADADICSTFNFGTFTGRYGNIYTSRQLVQLFRRAYGSFCPQEDIWYSCDGRVIDPFRPNIQPAGFVSEQELLEERECHFTAVREMFESLDYFVFTLGLTECWISSLDGAVFPVCPGVAGGTFNPEIHKFMNLDIEDVVEDMSVFINALRSVNQNAKIILTVSPVPLIATAEDRHVLVSTTYSKSVLRVASEVLVKRNPNVEYFPSLEIITGAFNRGRYFGPDLRSVTDEGVQHVMRLFMLHATDTANSNLDTRARATSQMELAKSHLEHMKLAAQTVCDEELLSL